MGTSNPPPTLSAAEAAAYFTIAALLDTVIGLRSFPGVLHGDLLNPDSYMRLDRLHDILARHAPLHMVLHDVFGAGAVPHWSHLLDSLLLSSDVRHWTLYDIRNWTPLSACPETRGWGGLSG